MKKVVSLLIALALVLSMTPVVFAAEEVPLESIEESISCTIETAGEEYWYYWVATEDGTINVIGGSNYDAENMTIAWSVDGGDEYDAGAEAVAIAEGEELWVCVASNTAGIDVTFAVNFVTLPGTEGNPILLQENKTTVTNEGTMYYQGRFSGATLTVTGEGDFTVIYGEETIAAVDGVASTEVVAAAANQPIVFAIDGDGEFDVAFTYPLGSVNNPAELKIGENVATINSGNSEGYNYTYTATEEGTLTITMPEGDWVYSVSNETANTAGETIYSDDEDVQTSYSVDVLVGDVINVMVNTYNPADMWNNPAGELTVIASFVAGDVESREPDVIVGELSASNVALAKNETITVAITPGENTTLGLAISGDPMFGVSVSDGDSDSDNDIFLGTMSGTSEQFYWQVLAGTTYTFTIRVRDSSGWLNSAGTVSYTFALDAEEVEQKEEYVISQTALALGDNTLTPEANAENTLYVFTPTEVGVYTFTVPAWASVGNWGAGEWFLQNPDSTMNTLEWTCTGVGQSAFIGVSGVEDEFNLNVAKTGDYTEVEIPLYTYENKAELSAYTLPDCVALGDYVDVTEVHTAVLGEDGYYHLDSADGDILLIDMNYSNIVLTEALSGGRGIMYAYTTDADGNQIKYDIGAAVQAYEAVMDADGYYPLTEDLIFFYDVYATDAGVWSFNLEGIDYDEDTAWMYCCRTMTIKHTYAYTDNGDGTHDYGCSVCGLVEIDNETHTYTDGVCVCGAIEKFDFAGVNMDLGNSLTMNFAVAASNISDGYYAEIVKTYADERGDVTYTIPMSDWELRGSTYIIAFKGIAAKEMADNITATIYNANGQAVSNPRSETIRAYAIRQLAKSTASAELKTTLVDMLNYGAAAQVQFGYNTADLANSTLTAEQAALATAEVSAADNRVKGDNYGGSQLILESQILMKIAFLGVTSDMSAQISYTDHNGNAHTIDVAYSEMEAINSTMTAVLIDELVIADACQLVTVTVYNADGTVHGTGSDSVESYAARQIAKGESTLATLCETILKFGVSAYNYFH